MAPEMGGKGVLMVEALAAAELAREPCKNVDDDGRHKRTGTLLTASAHIITAVIGSGVLSLAWAIAQLGWVAGPAVLMAFSVITWFTSTMLADCYRSPDPIGGNRNYTYMDVVRANLGGVKVQLCGLAQYGNLIGVTIGYTITASISMAAVQRSDCFHANGHDARCLVSDYGFMIIFAGIQVVLSQIPNFHKLWWLSIVAAVMSFAYSTIGLGLSIAKIAERPDVRTSLTGVTVGVDVTGAEKVWRTFQSLGDIAFAYSYSNVLIEIQDTLKSSPPENVVMKKASFIGVSTTTMFYMLCGCLGYAAFGNNAPGNFLTGFGFYDPFWLVDVGNICIAVHLIGAYQVFSLARNGAGVLPARLPVRGDQVPGEVAGKRLHKQRVLPRAPPARRRLLFCQPLPRGLADGVRRRHRRRCHDLPVLQRLPGTDRRFFLLAAHRLLPGRDVHRPVETPPLVVDVDVAQDPELRLPGRLGGGGHGIGAGTDPRRGELQAIQEPELTGDLRRQARGRPHVLGIVASFLPMHPLLHA